MRHRGLHDITHRSHRGIRTTKCQKCNDRVLQLRRGMNMISAMSRKKMKQFQKIIKKQVGPVKSRFFRDGDTYDIAEAGRVLSVDLACA